MGDNGIENRNPNNAVVAAACISRIGDKCDRDGKSRCLRWADCDAM